MKVKIFLYLFPVFSQTFFGDLALSRTNSVDPILLQSCASAVLERYKLRPKDSGNRIEYIRNATEKYLKTNCSILWGILKKYAPLEYDHVFTYSDVDVDAITKKTSPPSYAIALEQHSNWSRYHHALIGIANYMDNCRKPQYKEFLAELRDQNEDELAALAERQCKNGSYLRSMAVVLSRVARSQLRENYAEVQPRLKKELEFYSGWLSAEANTKTKGGRDGVEFLEESCEKYQSYPQPSSAQDLINYHEILYRHPEISNNLMSIEEAKSLMKPFWANVKTCKDALQSLKNKNKNKKIAESGKKSGWKNFKPTPANLEKMCILAANMFLGQPVRFQYILMGARMNGLSAQNHLAITRYMRSNCSEYMR